MEPVYILIVGITIGFVLASKPDALRNLPAKQFSYVLLGLASFGATFLLGWPGFACVMTAVFLYLIFGSDEGSNVAKSFFAPITGSIKWLRERQWFVKPKKDLTAKQLYNAKGKIVDPTADVPPGGAMPNTGHAVPPESEAIRSDQETFLEDQQTREDLEYLSQDPPPPTEPVETT